MSSERLTADISRDLRLTAHGVTEDLLIEAADKLDGLIVLLAAAETARDQLRAHILDIDAHATPYGDLPDEPGYIGVYLLSAGALHRALGRIGHTSPSCQAEARERGDWQWGVHLVVPRSASPHDEDFEGYEYDEWWDGTEAEARKWLHTPRQGPVQLSLIRRRPARPAGPVETIEATS